MRLTKAEAQKRDTERKRQRCASDPAFKARVKAKAKRWRERNPERSTNYLRGL